MRRLQIMAYNPWQTDAQSITWGVGYNSESSLYGIIQKARKEYAEHCITLYYEDGHVVTYRPLHREQQYI